MPRLTDFHGLRVYGLDCTLRSPQPLTLRGYYGGWLRGVLGHALFRGNCVYPEPRCAGYEVGSYGIKMMSHAEKWTSYSSRLRVAATRCTAFPSASSSELSCFSHFFFPSPV